MFILDLTDGTFPDVSECGCSCRVLSIVSDAPYRTEVSSYNFSHKGRRVVIIGAFDLARTKAHGHVEHGYCHSEDNQQAIWAMIQSG